MNTDAKESQTKSRQEDLGAGIFLQANERKNRTEKSAAEK
jgi:hypothetical protein